MGLADKSVRDLSIKHKLFKSQNSINSDLKTDSDCILAL